MMEKDDGLYYIVAGDEMQKLMRSKFPNRKTIPFREDFSKGEYSGFSFNSETVSKRAAFWGVSEKDYLEKLSPIVDLDITKNYVLCFGEDECCKANLAFMIGYLKNRGYAKAIKVQILNEYDLDLLKKYSAD